MRMPPPPRHGRWRAKFSTTGKPSPPSSPTPISRRQTTTPRRRCDMPSSLDASASAQEQTKGREPMPPFSASSKHAGDENSTRGRSSPKPSQTPEGASRLPCCLLPCCQPDKGEVNGYVYGCPKDARCRDRRRLCRPFLFVQHWRQVFLGDAFR